MQRLRHASFLARLVLAWFALVVGVATAAPLVQPQSLEMICAGAGGMKLIVQGQDDGQAPATVGLDCPLCAAVAPAPAVAALPQVLPLAHALRSIPAARIAALTGGPLPARGPPAHA